jgi:RND family efflux transporter MFP subunit
MSTNVEGNVSQSVNPARADKNPDGGKILRLAGFLTLLVVLTILAVVILGLQSRRLSAKALANTAQEAVATRVSVAYPEAGGTSEELVLPGNAQAFVDAPIYARTQGYLKHWYFDIGAYANQGQLLAEIEVPELDQQLAQARADLKTAEANMGLAETTAARWQSLLSKNAVSKQETDQAVSDFKARQAAVDASAANVRRLEQLQSYEKVYAPFDGVITARETDIGALIDGTSSRRELFHLAALDKLRVFVPVPEVSAAGIRNGAQVTLTSDEYSNQIFHGTIARDSSAVDPASRTLNVEVDVENRNHKLLPGSYVFVHIKVPSTAGGLTIPANTLLFRAQGLQVGVVRNGRAELVSISVGRDYGSTVEVTSGLHQGDAVILNPSDSLISGERVQVEKGDQL